MLKYNPRPFSASPVRTVTGRYLAKNQLGKRARALLAADLLTGKAVMIRPCIKQVAALCRVSLASVPRPLNGKRAIPTLADRLEGASPNERIAAAARLGPAAVWDTMISPLLDQERARHRAQGGAP